MWIARDENYDLYLYDTKPVKSGSFWQIPVDERYKAMKLNLKLFPDVKWEDKEPLEVDIIPKVIQSEKCEEAKTIDWEQRRYEIAKSAMQGYCIALGMNDDSETYNDIAMGAIRVADALIKELKKGE